MSGVFAILANLSDQFTHACAHFDAIASYLEGNLSGVKAPVSPWETGKEASSRSVERDARRDVPTRGRRRRSPGSPVSCRLSSQSVPWAFACAPTLWCGSSALGSSALRTSRSRLSVFPSRYVRPSLRNFPAKVSGKWNFDRLCGTKIYIACLAYGLDGSRRVWDACEKCTTKIYLQEPKAEHLCARCSVNPFFHGSFERIRLRVRRFQTRTRAPVTKFIKCAGIAKLRINRLRSSRIIARVS